MSTRRFTFRRWHGLAILVWWIGSALAAGLVADDEAAMEVRLAAAGVAWAATLAAPYLFVLRVRRLDSARARTALLNLFLGAFWASGFALASAAYYAITDEAGRSASAFVLLFLLPPSAAAFSAVFIALSELGGDDTARGPRSSD